MAEEETVVDYEQLEPIPVLYGFGTIIGSVIIFQAINQAVIRCLPTPDGIENPWKWRNLFVSWVHAVIVGAWDLSCFYWYPELVTDLIAFHNLYLYTMVAFSTGYFVHDFIDIVMNKNLLLMWEVIPHHFAVAGMFFYNVLVSRCISYNVVALLAEVNTIFLHLRKLLQLAGFQHDHPACRINAGVNLFTFVTCRFSGLIWIVGGMYVWGHRVTPLYFYILGTSMFVMWVTNIALFWRLLSSDVIKPWRRAHGRASNIGHISTSGSMVNGSRNFNQNSAVIDKDSMNGGIGKTRDQVPTEIGKEVVNGEFCRKRGHDSTADKEVINGEIVKNKDQNSVDGMKANGVPIGYKDLIEGRIDYLRNVKNNSDVLLEKSDRNGKLLECRLNNINVSNEEQKEEHQSNAKGVNNNIREENGVDSLRHRKP